jgi:uncharacterized peroxidase-related enzyme
MYLPEVEANPKPSPYGAMIQTMHANGSEYPQIWHMFAYHPKATEHLARFTQEILRGPAPLSPGIRELIAAYTSYRNDCPFWLKSHAAVAAELLGSEELVWGVLRDLDSSGLDEKHKALFRFIDKVNRDSPRITAEDTRLLRAEGWDDEAIYFAITVCSLFNFYNRWIDASGVHALSEEAHRQGGKRSAANGYARTPEWTTALGCRISAPAACQQMTHGSANANSVPPAGIATYCLPSNAYVIGEE